MKLDFLRGAARQVAFVIAIGGALAALAMKSAAVDATGNAAPVFVVRIQVSLFDSKPVTRLKQSSGVVVWLVPTEPAPETIRFEPPRYRLVQYDKRFLPHLLVIPVGSMVEFNN